VPNGPGAKGRVVLSNAKRYRDAAIVTLLVAVPFFVLAANMRKREHLNAVDRALLRLSAPVQVAAATVARGLSRIVADYVYLVDVKVDNDRLGYENARLRERNRMLERLERENRELRRLLSLRQSVPGDLVSAEVIGRDFVEFYRATRLILDRRSREVRAHMPVISADGVVGAVLHEPTGDTVDVQLAVDAGFGLDVEDERTHARGFVRGMGDSTRYACRVEMMDSKDDVAVGDLLVTSGKGKWFPRGIPVARVTKVIARELGRDQTVEAAPTVDFTRLDAVLIVVSTPEGAVLGDAPTMRP
jgi:rod shape-determining protein MreC